MRSTPRHDLTDVAGAPETVLTAAALASLPGASSSAPWTCRLDAVLWWRALTADARRALAASDSGSSPGMLAVAVGAFVRYRSTPVGGYCELVLAVVSPGRLRPRVEVPFLAVDSEQSLVDGRSVWGLPKVLAELRSDGQPAGVPSHVQGSGWSVDARPSPGGPTVPVVGAAQLSQLVAGRRWRAGLLAAGAVRAARVDVRLGGHASFGGWSPDGRCAGAVVTDGVLRLAAPRAAADGATG